MDYTNFIRNCLDWDIPMDEMMKEEIESLFLMFETDKAIDIIVYDLIPSLHHEANKIREELISEY